MLKNIVCLFFIYLGAYLSFLFYSVGIIGCGDMSVSDPNVCLENARKALPWMIAHGSALGFLFYQLCFVAYSKVRKRMSR